MWGIGAWWRSTRAAEAECRCRLARELHDVVIHIAQSLAAAGDTDHGTEGTEPPVGRLLTLVEQTRRAVQEAPTNALKYAPGSSTSVQVRHGEGEIAVEVGTDGSGTKAASLGGDFSAGSPS